MKQTMTATTSREVWLSRMILAAAAAPVLGEPLRGPVLAAKKGKNTIASVDKRLENAKDTSETIGNGTLDTVPLPSSAKITYREGGTHDGTRCKHTSREPSCRCSHTGQPGDCTQALTCGKEPADGSIS